MKTSLFTSLSLSFLLMQSSYAMEQSNKPTATEPAKQEVKSADLEKSQAAQRRQIRELAVLSIVINAVAFNRIANASRDDLMTILQRYFAFYFVLQMAGNLITAISPDMAMQ